MWGVLLGVDPDMPVTLPKEIEGLPVNTYPVKPMEPLSHTFTTKIRPIHGAGPQEIMDDRASNAHIGRLSERLAVFGLRRTHAIFL